MNYNCKHCEYCIRIEKYHHYCNRDGNTEKNRYQNHVNSNQCACINFKEKNYDKKNC